MNKLFSFLAVFFFMISCSKKNDTPYTPPEPPPVAALADTLPAGWTKIRSLPNESFSDIFVTNSNTGYATGLAGIFKSINGGVSWNKIREEYNLINIAAIGNDRACFVNNFNNLLTTQNGGAVISSTVYNAPGGSVTFEDCFFSDVNTCYAISGRYIWKSFNGGILFDTIYNFQIGQPTASLFFLNNNFGAVLRSDGIYATFTGGTSWNSTLNLANANGGLEFTDQSRGICVLIQNSSGIAEVFRTADAGGSWQSVFQTGSQSGVVSIPDVDFVSAAVGYFSHANRIFKTTDGGSTWAQIVGLGNQTIREIHFTDANHGWACTSDGTVIRFLQ